MDETCLGKGKIYLADGSEYGINGNELVIGSTYSGKTTSITEPRILHTFDRSLVIPVSKRRIVDLYAPILRDRGYEVLDINFVVPEETRCGYDPLRYIVNDKEMMNLARELYGENVSRTMTGEADGYWGEATISVIGAIIGGYIRKALELGKNPSFYEMLLFYQCLEPNFSGSHCRTNLDKLFREIEEKFPNDLAPRLWRTFSGNSSRTAACIYSMVNNVFDKLSEESLKCVFRHEEQIDVERLGEEKVALFITTSIANEAGKKLTDLLYTDIFKRLLLLAERNGGSLKQKVHVICDDFACGNRIPNFEKYISVFCSAGISVTLLLQSLSQLMSMYGESAGTTIQNNCDTQVFLGSTDITTCKEISVRANVSLQKILSMPVGKTVIARRGEECCITDRYPLYEDELYQKYVKEIPRV